MTHESLEPAPLNLIPNQAYTFAYTPSHHILVEVRGRNSKLLPASLQGNPKTDMIHLSLFPTFAAYLNVHLHN